MKIGVVADTHSLPIPTQLISDFKSVNFIIHAGDFCAQREYDLFCKIKEVKAVWGNMDAPKLKKFFPRREIIDVDGVRIGVYHGEGPAAKTLDYVINEFKGEDLQAVIFGHSHHAFNEVINGVLYFNPGSPNDTVVAPFCSYGILEVKNKRITGKIIKVKS
jgi:putative phosphoesterase